MKTKIIFGYVTHSTSAGCHGGNLHAYFVYTVTCDGLLIDGSELYPFQTSLVLSNARGMEGLIGLCGSRTEHNMGVRTAARTFDCATARP